VLQHKGSGKDSLSQDSLLNPASHFLAMNLGSGCVEASGSICGSIWKHLGSSGRGIWEASARLWEASGGHLGGSRRHLGSIWGHLGGSLDWRKRGSKLLVFTAFELATWRFVSAKREQVSPTTVNYTQNGGATGGKPSRSRN
jgi:hypothetical protein